MKPTEVRNMSVEEIRGRIDDAREELMNLRFRVITGQLTDTSQLKIIRRQIAMMETISHEMVRGESGKVK